VGWMSVQTTQMRDHKYFGNLRVSTLLDGMALSGVMQGTISLVSSRLVSEGEDLLVSNPVCACKVTIDRRITNSAVTNTLLPGILEFLVMSFSFLLRVRIAEYKARSSKMLRPLRPVGRPSCSNSWRRRGLSSLFSREAPFIMHW